LLKNSKSTWHFREICDIYRQDDVLWIAGEWNRYTNHCCFISNRYRVRLSRSATNLDAYCNIYLSRKALHEMEPRKKFPESTVNRHLVYL
jgi:hypothetical protein